SLNRQLKAKRSSLILAFDEVQLLKQIKFDYILASIFDNYLALKVVVTGSEVGLVDSFLGKEDYDAPLYGRALTEIIIKKQNTEDTSRFLEEGFAQFGGKISFAEINEVIAQLDGIIGWSTFYGWLRYKNNSHAGALAKVRKEGKETARRELQKFLDMRKTESKYLRLLKYLAQGYNTWGELKYNFAKDKLKVADSQLLLYLNELRDYGFVEKAEEQYLIPDPLLVLAVKERF
ncbi:MAG: ATP-binding protein, partial [Nanoarchaeota archaeon]